MQASAVAQYPWRRNSSGRRSANRVQVCPCGSRVGGTFPAGSGSPGNGGTPGVLSLAPPRWLPATIRRTCCRACAAPLSSPHGGASVPGMLGQTTRATTESDGCGGGDDGRTVSFFYVFFLPYPSLSLVMRVSPWKQKSGARITIA